MAPKPDDSFDDFERQAIELGRAYRARKAAGIVDPTYTTEQVRGHAAELLRRLEAAGATDPAAVAAIRDQLMREVRS